MLPITFMTIPKPAKKAVSPDPVEDSECSYVAYCTEDGVCPYDISNLMKKVQLQAIKDTVELIKSENGTCPSIQIDDELN